MAYLALLSIGIMTDTVINQPIRGSNSPAGSNIPFYKYEYVSGKYMQMRAYARHEFGLVSVYVDTVLGCITEQIYVFFVVDVRLCEFEEYSPSTYMWLIINPCEWTYISLPFSETLQITFTDGGNPFYLVKCHFDSWASVFTHESWRLD